MFGLKRNRQRRQLEREEAVLDQQLANVKFFPGNLEECGSYLGFPVEYIVLQGHDAEVTYARRNTPPFKCIAPISLKMLLVEEKVIALVHVDNALSIDSRNGYVYERKYGVPVRRKNRQ